MSKISAVIITFNEEKYIEQCIRSVADVADEIVVVDSFSNDRTKEICLSKGVRFIEHPFSGYRDQKNFALTQASNDYILALDADEEISPELEKSILGIKQDFRYEGYKFNRLNRFCGKWIYHTNLSPECKIRLFNRKKANWGGLNVHETVILNNPKSVKTLKGNLLHWLYDSYEESLEKINMYSTLLAREYFKKGIRATPKRLLINPLWRFVHSYFLKVGFLDGLEGFEVSKLLSISCFMKYVKLRNLYKQARKSKKENSWNLNFNSSDFAGEIKEEFRPISIGFDAKRAFFNYSGLGNYSRNLLFSLSKNYPGNAYYLFTPKTKDRFPVENYGHFNLIQPKLAIHKLINPLWRIKYMNSEIKWQKLEIFHGLSQELPFGIEKTGVKSVITVHDLIFMRYPEFYNWVDARIYYWKLVHACRVSHHIVAMSKQTKQDLIKFLSIPESKISVIHQGCNQYFWKSYTKEFFQEVRIKYNLPERYLLNVGTVEERKNLLGIVKALHIANINIPLVVVGRKVDIYFKKVLNYISEHKINNIIFPEHISNLELPVIYQNAECFIYPSYFEGFGIPLVEALVSRTPVISSNRGCFSEAAGPGSIYIDPLDPEEIGKAILTVVNNKEIRDKMISVGAEYANKFNDTVIADTYMRLYNSLLK